MDISETMSQLITLPISDRLRVVATVWDSIEADTPASLSSQQRKELDRRIAAHKHNPEELLSWDQVLDQLRMNKK